MMIAPLRLAQPKPIHSGETHKRPNCPHCGRRVLLAEQSRFDFVGRIDHFWVCDDCGTEFATSIEVTRQAVA
jgi:DNA-directed RNA polymerase subunit RPC12/RpoP